MCKFPFPFPLCLITRFLLLEAEAIQTFNEIINLKTTKINLFKSGVKVSKTMCRVRAISQSDNIFFDTVYDHK